MLKVFFFDAGEEPEVKQAVLTSYSEKELTLVRVVRWFDYLARDSQVAMCPGPKLNGGQQNEVSDM